MSIATHVALVESSGALRVIQGHAAVGNIRFTHHAEERMVERHVTRHGVRCALVTATLASEAGKTWRLTGGVDTDGDGLTVVV